MFKKLLLPVVLLLSAGLSLWLPGCKPREEELQTSGGLEFSADTVKFDTVFTTLRTVTKRLWVYNRNAKGVNVDLITLDQPTTSPYKLIINGDVKQTASNLFIRGNDSLLILVRGEQLPDNGQSGAAKGYVLEEKLNFSTNGQDQHVLLRSFGQNIYLHDGTNKAAVLACNEEWKSDRPHVLYGSVVVGPGCTLRIKPGTRIYGHAGAALIVYGKLLVNAPADFAPGTGATDTIKASDAHIVRFAGDRSSEAQYATAPGQWTGIVLAADKQGISQGNIIRYAQIQNATFGVLLYNPLNLSPQPDVKIQNSVIRYISGNDVGFAGAASSLGAGGGVLSLLGKATLENTLFSDCYEYAVLGNGGTYDLNFCTIANYAPTSGIRQTPSLAFTNTLTDANGQTLTSAPTITVRNSIVWGSAAVTDELFFDNYDKYPSNVSVQNSLLRTKLYAAATYTSPNKPGLSNPAYNNLFTDPVFVRANTGSGRDDYRLKTTSPARQPGAAVGNRPDQNRDLLNLPRNPTTPSLGAYESLK